MISENYVTSLKEEIELCDDTIRSLQDTLQLRDSQKDSLWTDLELANGELIKCRGDCESLKTDNSKLTSQLERVVSELHSKASEMAKYKVVYMAAERSRILKKNEANRTPEEILILESINN